jgi:putative flippase GtrA
MVRAEAWRFAHGRPWVVQLVQFLTVSVVGLAINDVVVVAFHAPLGTLLGHPNQGYLAAKVVATGVAVLWNFFANRYWTFGEAGQTDPARSDRADRPGATFHPAPEVDDHAV